MVKIPMQHNVLCVLPQENTKCVWLLIANYHITLTSNTLRYHLPLFQTDLPHVNWKRRENISW